MTTQLPAPHDIPVARDDRLDLPPRIIVIAAAAAAASSASDDVPSHLLEHIPSIPPHHEVRVEGAEQPVHPDLAPQPQAERYRPHARGQLPRTEILVVDVIGTELVDELAVRLAVPPG
jgi:hypothetical protein